MEDTPAGQAPDRQTLLTRVRELVLERLQKLFPEEPVVPVATAHASYGTRSTIEQQTELELELDFIALATTVKRTTSSGVAETSPVTTETQFKAEIERWEHLQVPSLASQQVGAFIINIAAQTCPKIAKLALSYLGSPASSAPVERLWSRAGQLDRKGHGAYSPDNFEKVMFCHFQHWKDSEVGEEVQEEVDE
jgi:hypothetical protein